MNRLIRYLESQRSARLALALLAGILNGVGFIWWGSVSLIANIPLLLALCTSRSLRESMCLGGLVGFFAGLHIYGIAHYGWFLLIFFSFYTASQMVLYGALFNLLWRRLNQWGHLILPICLWSLTEWIRTLGPYSMPASYVGNMALEDYFFPWLYLSPWLGGLFVSGCVALVQSIGFLWFLDSKRYQPQLIVGLCVFITLGIFGGLTPPTLGNDPLQIIGVQAGLHNSRYDAAKVDPYAKEELLDTFESLTKEAYEHNPQVVIWPETAIRDTVMDKPFLRERFIPPAGNTATLIAGLHTRKEKKLYNAAVAVTHEGVQDEVHKIRLVMGTEDHFSQGESHLPLSTQWGELGMMICLEAVYPQIGQTLSNAGAEALIVISNDAGFGFSPITHHMTRRATVRALETGRWLVRVGQAGLSVIVSPRGEVVQSLSLFTPALLKGTIHKKSELTLFVAYPWLYPIGNLLLLLSLPLLARRR